MARSAKDPKALLPEIIQDFREVFGNDLISLILYGSAAGPEYDPARSDINLMAVLRPEAMGRLDEAFSLVRKWRRKGCAVPLFLTERYIAGSLDVFPIEYLNFRSRYAMVYGKDVLRGLELKPSLLRLQCEREIKGKLLLLREGFVESEGKRGTLAALIADSTGALTAIFRALAALKGLETPGSRRALFAEVSRAFDLDGGVFERLLDVRDRKIKGAQADMPALFKRYLAEMEKLSDAVDAMGG